MRDNLGLPQEPRLSAEERDEALQRFYRITVHFESKYAATPESLVIDNKPYNKSLLVKLTYEYSRNEISKDGFLREFFKKMETPMGGDITTIDLTDVAVEAKLEENLALFANELMTNFFMPMMVNMGRTPQVTPESDSAEAKQDSHEVIGTTGRLGGLRRDCLVRDRHRCVVTHVFDRAEAAIRYAAHNHKDDDGVVFHSRGERDVFTVLEVAHIIPHALLQLNGKIGNMTLDATREAAIKILDMFDQVVSHMINGAEIDQPQNALTLAVDMHRDFGNYMLFFTPVPGQENTYDIQSFHSTDFDPRVPVRRTLYLTPERTIDPPSPRLLAVHRAVAHILHLSGAGEYIRYVLRDLEETAVRADGSTPLADLVRLGLSDLLPATV